MNSSEDLLLWDAPLLKKGNKMQEFLTNNPLLVESLIAFLGVLISAVFALIGVLFSLHNARKIAKDSAKNEIEKMSLLWRHETDISIKRAVGEVCAYVSIFLWKRDTQSYKDAFIKINEARAITTGPIASILDGICYDIEQRRNETFAICDEDIRLSLAKAIDECRQDENKTRAN